MSSDSSIQRSLRRIRPERYTRQLEQRERSALPFLTQLKRPLPKLLLDTTVYIDEFQGTLPHDVELSLQAGELWHSTVTESELTALAGLLDPSHPQTSKTVRTMLTSVEKRPTHRILNPDRDAWREAGILAGLLARLQGYSKSEQRRSLNDALIFLSAAKHGCSVLTRNLRDFDLLMQLAPYGRSVFYDRLPNS